MVHVFSRFPGLKVLHSKNGDVPVSSLEGKHVLVYFSAHWCPPCRAFTPQLATFYRKYSKEKNFEIVFASWDQNRKEFDEYFQEQPWLALPFGESKQIMDKLQEAHRIQSIPTLLVFDGEGKLVTREGRMSVVKDPTAANFPWPNADNEAQSGMNPRVMVGLALLVLVYLVFFR